MSLTDITLPKDYVVVSDTEPTGQFDGQLWVDTSGATPITYVFTNDDWTLVTQDNSTEISNLQTAVTTTIPGTIKMDLIATQTLTGDATNITFSTLSTDYKKFIIQANMITKSDANPSAANLIVNEDSGAYYNNSGISITGASTIAGFCGSGSKTTYCYLNPVNFNAADMVLFAQIEIDNSVVAANMGRAITANSVINTIKNNNGNAGTMLNTCFYAKNDRVTSVKITLSAGNYIAGSTATIWGLK